MRINQHSSKKHNLNIRVSQLVLSELTAKKSFWHCGPVTTTIIAIVFKTRANYRRYNHDPENSLQASVNYWSRIKRGERTIKDKYVIDSINKILPWAKEVLLGPFCKILTTPHCTKKKLDDFIVCLNGFLENKFYFINKKDNEITQKRFYWKSGTEMSTNISFFSYQLVLIRMMSLNNFEGHLYLSAEKVTVHLLRILMTTPLQNLANEILVEFFNFMATNARALSINPPVVDNKELQKNPLPYVIEMCMPKDKNRIYMQSFSSYLNYHNNLIDNLTKQLFQHENCVYSNEIYSDILYWTDYFSHAWLTDDIEKTDLFHKDQKAYAHLRHAILTWNAKPHRIW